eukprot:50296-Rhodomonas_salina.1
MSGCSKLGGDATLVSSKPRLSLTLRSENVNPNVTPRPTSMPAWSTAPHVSVAQSVGACQGCCASLEPEH